MMSFEQALGRLKEGCDINIEESTLLRDGVIQRFEFTFELSWKLMKSLCNFYGVEANSPRDAIKQAHKISLIQNGNKWLDLLQARNLTSHTYNEEISLSIYEIIPDSLKLFGQLLAKTKEIVLENQ